MTANLADAIAHVKLVLLGETTVGKTSIIAVSDGNPFTPDQSATVGACFHIKTMKSKNSVVKTHIWDTAGQERFRALAPMYYRDAQFALLVYAIDNRESFDEIDSWYDALVQDCSPMPHIVLVANKIDLVDCRQVSLEEGRALAKRLSAMFFEVTAKADAPGVKRMFEEIAIEAVKYFGQTPEKKKPLVPTDGSAGGCSC
jgi:small GTP-binding protein